MQTFWLPIKGLISSRPFKAADVTQTKFRI